MNSKYKVFKFKKNKFENTDDFISIEEPLEISLKYRDQNKWLTNSLSITNRKIYIQELKNWIYMKEKKFRKLNLDLKMQKQILLKLKIKNILQI